MCRTTGKTRTTGSRGGDAAQPARDRNRQRRGRQRMSKNDLWRDTGSLTADELLAELRRFAAERNGDGIEDPEDAWWYQACFVALDAAMRAGDGPQEWRNR